jgi:nucleotide-binding universal stress UspA family protein
MVVIQRRPAPPALICVNPARIGGGLMRAMYRHILVPTDGSAASLRASRLAAGLAARCGARLTSIYVVPEGVPTLFSGDKLYGGGVLSRATRAAIRQAAAAALDAVAREADKAGVPHASRRTLARAPWQAIVHAARAADCDLIVMATHGRRGLAALGSQTMKTVAHSAVPVLVCR